MDRADRKDSNTPGDWTAVPSGEDYQGHVISGGGRIVAMTHAEDAIDVSDEERANAALLAAAPDLLAALENMVRFEAIATGLHPVDVIDIWPKARAAIARARGESKT